MTKYDFTQGKCDHCKLAFNWKRSAHRRLKDTRCPNCGQRLKPTVYYLKRYPWYSLDGEDGTKPYWGKIHKVRFYPWGWN